jgi:hypothetical protein
MRLGESRRGGGGRCDALTETAILDRFNLETDEMVDTSA